MIPEHLYSYVLVQTVSFQSLICLELQKCPKHSCADYERRVEIL